MIVHFWTIYLNSFFVFFQWFELCFQASFLVANRIHFWSSFSIPGRFLEQFLVHFLVIFRSFLLIFRSWAHFGSAGGQLFHYKNGLDHQRRPKRHFPQNPIICLEPFRSNLLRFFRFLSLVFKHSFC